MSWGRRFHLSNPTSLFQPLSDTADFTLLFLSTTEQHHWPTPMDQQFTGICCGSSITSPHFCLSFFLLHPDTWLQVDQTSLCTWEAMGRTQETRQN